MPLSEYVSDVTEIGRLVGAIKSTPIVLYCNGPFCGKSKRLSAELVEAGYANGRRYQLGIPVWPALGGLTEIEVEGLRYVLADDRTAVFIDARDPGEFSAQTLPGARNLPRSGLKPGKDVGEVKAAKDDGRLPMEDHNTRIVVFGQGGAQAKAVAEAIGQEAFHDVQERLNEGRTNRNRCRHLSGLVVKASARLRALMKYALLLRINLAAFTALDKVSVWRSRSDLLTYRVISVRVHLASGRIFLAHHRSSCV
jgi:rhodanese-related sulfurtransferase